jgi:hypothetical protein
VSKVGTICPRAQKQYGNVLGFVMRHVGQKLFKHRSKQGKDTTRCPIRMQGPFLTVDHVVKGLIQTWICILTYITKNILRLRDIFLISRNVIFNALR